MNLHRRLTAPFVILPLGRCAPAATEQRQVPYAPYSHDSGADMNSGGGGMQRSERAGARNCLVIAAILSLAPPIGIAGSPGSRAGDSVGSPAAPGRSKPACAVRRRISDVLKKLPVMA
jgi:hypothetical protein